MHIWPIVLFCVTIALLTIASVLTKKEMARRAWNDRRVAAQAPGVPVSDSQAADLAKIFADLEEKRRRDAAKWGPTTEAPGGAATLSRTHKPLPSFEMP